MRRFGLVSVFLGLPVAMWIASVGDAEAARWCVEAGARSSCAFESRRQCERAAGRWGGDCRRQYAQRGMTTEPTARSFGSAYPEFPTRPPNASPYTCYFDDGFGRYRPCDAGGAPP